MTIRRSAFIASLAIAMASGFDLSSANAQTIGPPVVNPVPIQNPQPGAPQVTSSSGNIQNLPPGSSVTLTLNLGNNFGGGQTLNPNAVTVSITDANGNVIAIVKPTVTPVGNPPTSYSYTFNYIMPGSPNTTYGITYVGMTQPGQDIFGGTVGIATGPPN